MIINKHHHNQHQSIIMIIINFHKHIYNYTRQYVKKIQLKTIKTTQLESS